MSKKLSPEQIEKICSLLRGSIGFHKEYGGMEKEVNLKEQKNGSYFLEVYPVDRGPRTDHGGGEDGDEWLDDYQLESLHDEYFSKNQRKVNKIKDIILNETGVEIEVLMDYGEKGHISLYSNFKI
ncbi:MAG: hypothetical protein GY909_16135 [Oligoflexia bacterium]|nr:hypothetical protein [Oligoflexia bacterium]